MRMFDAGSKYHGRVIPCKALMASFWDLAYASATANCIGRADYSTHGYLEVAEPQTAKNYPFLWFLTSGMRSLIIDVARPLDCLRFSNRASSINNASILFKIAVFTMWLFCRCQREIDGLMMRTVVVK